MSANYEIVPVIEKSNFDRGDTVRIEIYVSGGGTTDRKKLHILYPYPELFEESVGTLKAGVANVPEEYVGDDVTIHGRQKEGSDGSGNVARPRHEAPEEYRLVKELDPAGVTIAIPDWMFDPIPESLLEPDRSPDPNMEPAPTLPMKLIESKWEGNPPLEMELNISEEANPGDYEIDFIFTYEAFEIDSIDPRDLSTISINKEIKSSRHSAEFHINDWIEEKQPTLKRVVIAVALAGLFIPILGSLFPYLALPILGSLAPNLVDYFIVVVWFWIFWFLI